MTKEFIPYEQALELKELGFNEPCLTCYDKLEMVASHGKNVFDYKNYNSSGYIVSRPTFSQAFGWFREKHEQASIVVPTGDSAGKINGYYYEIIFDFSKENIESDRYETYEEAELACLRKLIDIVKNRV